MAHIQLRDVRKTFGAVDIPRKDYEKLLDRAMQSEDLEFAAQ